MATHEFAFRHEAQEATIHFLDLLFADAAPPGFAVRLWEGTLWRPPRATAEINTTVVLQHPGALRSMFTEPSDLTLGEAYIFNDFDVEGDLSGVFALVERLFERGFGVRDKVRYAALLRKLPKPARRHDPKHGLHLVGSQHSRERDRRAVTYHYDLSNDFYRLWLDRRMVYSCAYFRTPEDPLDQAQEQKLDLLCRKLRLKPGERLLDIGCGWGALIIHAARHYGVHACGITLSRNQAELATERIRGAGIEDRCRAEIRDYRDVTEENAFDKIVSVGMFEHVGEKMLPEYFARAFRLLRPGGVFLNHGIAESPFKPRRGDSFVHRYVFPDGELVPINVTLRAAESAGFEVRDVEGLREHYALTCDHWVRRLEENSDAARKLVGDVNCRIWRLYMAGGAFRFRANWMSVYQSLLAKPDRGRSGLPLTREEWYG